jgi:hypothetical protein
MDLPLRTRTEGSSGPHADYIARPAELDSIRTRPNLGDGS